MVDIEIVSLDGTGDPAKDGCTATATVLDTNSGSSGDYVWSYTYYQLKAKPKGKWKFDHFEATQRRWDASGWSQNYESTFYHDVIDADGYYVYPQSRRNNYLCEGYFRSEEDGIDDEEEITRLKAVFRRIPGTGKILCNEGGVILHGASGTVLYDD